MSFGIQGVQSSLSASSSDPSSNTATDPFSNLNLTTAQQQQIQQIFQQLHSGSITEDQARSQINTILTPDQQQTLQTDVQNLQKSHGHHHHHPPGPPPAADGGSNASILSQLGLTSDQQSQIGKIVQNAQAAGTSPDDLLSQIEGVLTDSQKQQLTALITGASSSPSSGSSSPASSVIVDTSA